MAVPMIVKAEDADTNEFQGVQFDVLAVGEESMVTKMHLQVGNDVPPHSHENEQSGYVISGTYRLHIGDDEEIIENGDTYAIPGGVEHSYDILESGHIIDVFTPPREDYL